MVSAGASVRTEFSCASRAVAAPWGLSNVAFWDSVKDSSNAAELTAYVDRFPNGSFVALAQTRLKALSEPEPKAEPNETPPAETMAIELAFWDSVKDSDNPAILQAYLGQYPEGSFATLAKVRLAELGSEPVQP